MHSRSSDPLDEALTAATEQICAAVLNAAASNPVVSNPVVVIDGRSGAGKSSLAVRLVHAWPLSTPAQLLALDSVYPGWTGLERGGEIIRECVLTPHAEGRIGTWRRWDWERGRQAETHLVDPALGLIAEGCGALTQASAALADVTVWVDGPPESRRARALARDGEGFRAHWEMWMTQEAAHMARHQPDRIAAITVHTP